MFSVFEEREEIILEKYLELAVLDDLYSRCAWLVGDEGDLSEKCSRIECRYLFPTLEDTKFPLDDIVCTSIGRITDGDDFFSGFSILSLTHEEKI